MNGMNYLYLASSNKHPSSNKRPPPRPLYQRSAPLPTIKCPPPSPLLRKKKIHVVRIQGKPASMVTLFLTF